MWASLVIKYSKDADKKTRDLRFRQKSQGTGFRSNLADAKRHYCTSSLSSESTAAV